MPFTKRLLEFLHKLLIKALIIICVIMLLHITVVFFKAKWMLCSVDSSPFDMALVTFLYYVVPLIALISFHLVITHLCHLYITPYEDEDDDDFFEYEPTDYMNIKNIRTVPTKSKDSKKSRTVPTKSKDSKKSRTVPTKSKDSKKSRTVPTKFKDDK